MSVRAPATAVELVPDKLFVLGGMVPVDGRLSWMDADDRGFQPLNCYLLKEGSSALLVDTGVALHSREILGQLDDLLEPGTDLEVFFTRAELECVGNLGAIAERFAVSRVRAGGVQNPFDSFDSVGEVGTATTDLELERFLGGESFAVGANRIFDVVVPPIRMLTTFWGFDRGTRTLFTSDLFGHTYTDAAAYAPVVTSRSDRCDYEQLRRNTVAKFWWLDEVVTVPVATALQELFAEKQVERVAPTHGCVLEGADVVARHLAWMSTLLAGAPGDQRRGVR